MKPATLLLLFFACMLMLGACMSPDDRDFYARGWINPRTMDAPAAEPVPVRQSPRDTPVGGVVPSARSDQGEWTTPPPFRD